MGSLAWPGRRVYPLPPASQSRAIRRAKAKRNLFPCRSATCELENRETSCDRHPRDLGTAGIIDLTMSRVPWSLCQEASNRRNPRHPGKGISGRPTGDAIQQAPATLSHRGSKPGNRQAEANIRPLSAGQRQVVCSESHTKKDRSPCSFMLALGPRKAPQACDRGDAAGPSITAQISGRCEPCMHYCARAPNPLHPYRTVILS